MDDEGSADSKVVDVMIGRVLDMRYRILRRLATGGMGKVYLAEQQGLGRTVAIKILSTAPSDVDATEFRDRFYREARLSSRLSHPNTVRVYDYGHTLDEIYYIVMEYLEGPTLTRILREGPLDPLRVIAFASQVCASLSEAHALGLIHRDLKPDNLIITRRADGPEFVRVVDFGIAKDVLSSEPATQPGTLYGSPGYMSPEQILQLDLTPASDIYSLGAVLYRMLTGCKPSTKADVMHLIHRNVFKPPPAFEESNPNIEVVSSLEWVTLQCLQQEPKDRFRSAAELARALRACDLELRGVLPRTALALTSGRLVLPPDAEEHLGRFDISATNTGPIEPVVRRPSITRDHHEAESVSPVPLALVVVAFLSILAVPFSLVMGVSIALVVFRGADRVSVPMDSAESAASASIVEADPAMATPVPPVREFEQDAPPPVAEPQPSRPVEAVPVSRREPPPEPSVVPVTTPALPVALDKPPHAPRPDEEPIGENDLRDPFAD